MQNHVIEKSLGVLRRRHTAELLLPVFDLLVKILHFLLRSKLRLPFLRVESEDIDNPDEIELAPSFREKTSVMSLVEGLLSAIDRWLKSRRPYDDFWGVSFYFCGLASFQVRDADEQGVV